MSILINKLHYQVRVLGVGRRAGIWLQGCTIRCFGCISRDTWPADSRFRVEVEDVLGWLDELPRSEVDGITLSGGEPFDQPEALQELVEGIDDWRAHQPHPTDVLAYSGRSFEELESAFSAQLRHLDAVVTEPFVQGDPTDLPLRGSANQRVVPLSPLGEARYTSASLEDLRAQRGQMQLEVHDEEIWMIGIPEQGAMRRVQARAAHAGIQARRPSWLI